MVNWPLPVSPNDILEAMRDVPEICEYLHIPVQSGSDAVLKRMRRQYSVSQYLDLIDQARDMVPQLEIASDFIVGFCGETDAEHDASIKLIERCQFKNIFVFKYSPRPDTVADKRSADNVADEIKRKRNVELLNLQEGIATENNQKWIGTTMEVLVHGYSKAAIKAQEAEQTRGSEIGWRRSDQLVGRTSSDQIVVFSGQEKHIGRFARVAITGTTALTLHGNLLEDTLRGSGVQPTRGRSLPVLEAV